MIIWQPLIISFHQRFGRFRRVNVQQMASQTPNQLSSESPPQLLCCPKMRPGAVKGSVTQQADRMHWWCKILT